MTGSPTTPVSPRQPRTGRATRRPSARRGAAPTAAPARRATASAAPVRYFVCVYRISCHRATLNPFIFYFKGIISTKS